MNLFTQYSPWWVIPCILLGLLYAFILYRKDDRLQDVASWMKFLLAALRTLVIAGIAFLLLGPFFRFIERQIQKPVILLAQDNSSSIVLGPDSAYYKGEYLSGLSQLVTELEEEFEVQRYGFDKELANDFEIDYSGKQSDLGEALDGMLERNVNRNIGAVILASDGIYNKGMSPAHIAPSTGVPVYTIAMGDTTVRRDLLIENVAHNRLSYLGNDFPLEILVKADRFAGKQSVLRVKRGGEELIRRTVDITDDAFMLNVPVMLNADRVGRLRYDISLSPLDGELSTSNNYRSIYLDVLDSRQKVLMLYDAPHPDLAAIRGAIESNDNYEVILNPIGGFTGELKEYDLLILHGAPAQKGRDRGLLERIKAEKTPVWLIGTLGVSWNDLKMLGTAVEVQMKSGNNTTDASPSVERGFTLFSLSDELMQSTRDWAPLKTSFADFSLQPSGKVLFYQRIGVVETEQPLWVFSELDGHKTSLTVGEGLWRWRIQDYVDDENAGAFNELISRTVQFLATKEDRRQFRVYGKDRFDEDQRVILEAELYNQSYDLINDPEVEVTFTDQDGNDFDFVFSRTQNSYFLDAGKLPVGQYSYTSKANFEAKAYSASGELVVSAIQIESVRTTADHQLMYRIAESTGGQMFYPQQTAELSKSILSKEEIVPLIYTSEKVSDLIESRWIFFLFLALLAIEWFIRKYKGGY